MMKRLLKPNHALSVFRRCYNGGLSPIMMDYNSFRMPHTNHQAAPLVIMHGEMASQDHWYEIGQVIGSYSSRSVFTVDARNHGGSPHTTNFTFRHMAIDTLQFMRSVGISRIVGIGHGMGGLAMMTFAMAYPQLVESLILVDVSPCAYPSDAGLSDCTYEYLTNVEIPVELSMAEARQVVRAELIDVCGNRLQANFLVSNLRRFGCCGEFYWACNYEAIHTNWHEFTQFESYSLGGLNPYPGPTLLIAGSRSNYVRREHISCIAEYLPTLTVQWVRAYHFVHIEQPRKFVNMVCCFTDLECC